MAETFLKKVGDFPEGVKVPPQLQVILTAMANHEHGAEVKALGEEVRDELKTRQDPVRVIMFYVPKMKEHNVVEITKIGNKAETVDADGNVIEKPAKVKKAKKAAQIIEDALAA